MNSEDEPHRTFERGRTARQLERYWLRQALQRAGIDSSHWNPALGTEANQRTIRRVYDYYGSLFLRLPRLKWAGMANMIGPAFYAGFLDIGFMPDLERDLAEWAGRVIAAGRRARDRILGRARTASDAGREGLGFFETTFLTMQRKIFEDLAPMHEAYLAGGLGEIRALASAGIVDEATEHAWQQIDNGDEANVEQGNRALLFREQYQIIDSFYRKMLEHRPPEGHLITYLLTIAGAPAIPRAKGYAEVFPITIAWSIPNRVMLFSTPLPDGNIAVFADRWQLIDRDTWPAFDRFVAVQPARARAIISTPIGRRVGHFRLLHRLGLIALAMLTRWSVKIERQTGRAMLVNVRRTAAARLTPGASVVVDLRQRRVGENEGGSSGSAQRTWTAAAPFAVNVLLPQNRSYSAVAQFAALTSTTPARFVVKLPPSDRKSATVALTTMAREWGANAAEIRRWATETARVTSRERAYSTRVFRAAPVGNVRIELQVEHHLSEDQYVIDVLFSWDPEI